MVKKQQLGKTMDGWTDGTDRQKYRNGWMNRWTDSRMKGWMDRQMDGR